MKTIKNTFRAITLSVLVVLFSGCGDLFDTNSSTDISEGTVLPSATNLNMVLTSAYRSLYFNFGGEDRVYAGLGGMQMYVDLGGADILSHDNMGGTQVTCYKYENAKTYYKDNAKHIWTMMYNIINQTNIVLDNIDAATGTEAFKKQIKGQALAIRGLCYFHLIQNYQQTYIIAKDKPGVLLRLSASDSENVPRSTVAQCYERIIDDLETAKVELSGFVRDNKWTIDEYIVSGILARVYSVTNEWPKALAEATIVYNKYNTLMTRDEYRGGFDLVITRNYAEVAWAMKFTDTDNLGGGTQFNFWFNQDPSFGEGYADGPIYSFLNFFADAEYEKLFEKTEDRYQFWKRTNNTNAAIYTKWAYDKFKHYGDAGGARQGNTRPEISLMRGSEMLLIMAEASAHIGNGQALTYLNRLQSARGVTNLTNASGQDLLEAIYVERRKELLCEGVTGIYDLLRLQKPLIRKGESLTNLAGHYSWGLIYLNGYDATSPNPMGTFPSNDYRFLCQIPELELANNTALTAADQNPFSGQ